MKRIEIPMFRYGEADFDREYMEWGLHDRETQAQESESVLQIIPSSEPLRILDLACGIGTHAVYWAKHGHAVTGVDISETFINEGRELANKQNVNVTFEVGDIKNLPYLRCFDAVTWVEKSFFDDEVASAINRYLADGGLFVMDVRNPEHPNMKRLNSNWRKWREEDGVFFLERHETDESDGMRHDEWIEINTATEEVTSKSAVWKRSDRDHSTILQANGFASTEFRTMSGDLFTGGEEPYWLWLVARK